MKFLTDSQANFLFVKMLRALGWEVETVYQHGLQDEPNDARLISWAEQRGMVFITFDELRGQSGVLVAGQIQTHGGKLIQIAGGPEQPPERAVGKLLFHYDKWYPFLQANDGRVNISDLRQRCRTFSRGEMQAKMTRLLQPQFEQYLKKKKAARTQPRRRRPRNVSHEQGRMLNNGA